MRAGRFVAVFLVLATLLAGGAAYYLQVYAYYERLPAQTAFAITPLGGDAPVAVPVSGFEGIDSDSAPIRFRACFTLEDPPALAGFEPYARPTPLNAPRWFSCFDAEAIGRALERGEATAWLAEADFTYGFDRVVAVFPDGRAYAWQQINRCGAAHYDGDPLPEGCPPPPS